MYFHINKTNRYNEEVNGNKDLILVHTDENKGPTKQIWKHMKILSEILPDHYLDNYDERYMNIEFNLDYD